MIELKGTIIIPLEAQNEALPALEAHIEATRQEAENVIFEVTQDETDPELFHVYEEFLSQAGFEEHQRLAKARPWGAVSQNFVRDFHKQEKPTTT